MTLQFELVRATLVLEVLIFALFSLPFIPSRIQNLILKGIRSWPHFENLKSAFRVLLVFVILLFADSLIRVTRIASEIKNKVPLASKAAALHDQGLYAKMFYAQRNVYLTGFTILMAVVLQRYFAILLANLSIGEQQRDLVKRLEALESAGVARRKTTHEQEKVQAELEALRAKMADAEVMIKQAQQQQDEYMRLADRYNELEKKYEGRLDEKAKSK